MEESAIGLEFCGSLSRDALGKSEWTVPLSKPKQCFTFCGLGQCITAS